MPQSRVVSIIVIPAHSVADSATWARTLRDGQSRHRVNADQLLTCVPLFQSQSKKHIGQIANLSTTHRYEHDQVIVRQNDGGLGLYVIA